MYKHGIYGFFMVFLEVGFVPFYYKNGEGAVLVRMVWGNSQIIIYPQQPPVIQIVFFE